MDGRTPPDDPASRPDRPDTSTSARLWVWVGHLVAVLVGIGLIVGAECALRALHYDAPRPVFIPCRGEDPRSSVTVDPAQAANFFARLPPGVPGLPVVGYREQFEARKPAGQVRVFVLGGSVVDGFPYPRACAFPSWMQRIFAHLYPDRRVEVTNLGFPGIGSTGVLRLLREAVDYEPDVVVVHCGHNEYYSPGGALAARGTPGPSLLTKVYNRTCRTRLYGLCRNTIRAVSEGLRRAGDQQEQVTEKRAREVASTHLVRQGGSVYEYGLSVFAHNVAEMVRICRQRQVGLILTTVAPNLRDISPLCALRPDHLNQSALARWERLCDQAVEGLVVGQCREALRALDEAERLDDACAHVCFRQGQCLWHLGRHDDARQRWQRACDLDVLRLRAPAAINDIIRRYDRDTFGSAGVIVADVEAAMQRAADGGAVGFDLVHDHVHLTRRGHYVVARVIVETLARSRLGEALGDSHLMEVGSQDHYERQLDVADCEIATAMARLERVWQGWPFRNQVHVQRFLQRTESLSQAAVAQLDAAARQVCAHAAAEPVRETVLLRLGVQALENKDYQRAVDLLTRAIDRRCNPLAVHDSLARAHLGLSQYAEAARHLHRVIQLGHDSEEHFHLLGHCLEKSGLMAEAIAAYQRCTARFPYRVGAYLRMADIQLRLGNTREGVGALREAAKLRPDDTSILKRLNALGAL